MLYRTYAKVNLSLEIVRKRDDGYHELVSLVHSISLSDDLRVEPHHDLLTRVEGLDIDPETNLVSRAAELLSEATRSRQGAELSLVKGIPEAAGLGGGSSDAATTLVGLNRLWGTRVGLAELAVLAAQLGADVPFFVRGGAALMRGIGDQLEALPPRVGQWLVLLVPPHNVLDKTKRLYGALEPGDFSTGETTLQAAAGMRSGEALEAEHLLNGFARAARSVFDNLSETWSAAERLTQRRFCLSGAGPSIFALAKDRADAQRQVRLLSSVNAQVYSVRTVHHARVASRISYP